MKALRRGALVAVLILVTAEAFLQLASLFVGDRSGAWRADAEVRVLCVGDSHTYGAAVPDGESYPAHLQALLDARQPRRFSVVNLGIPGLNTTQVRNRLPLHVARYQPDIVILWCGTNNAWNRSELDREVATWRTRFGAVAYHFRLYRFARVWWNDRVNRVMAAQTRGDGVKQNAKRRLQPDREVWIVRHGGVAEEIHNLYQDQLLDDGEEARAYEDYGAMLDWLDAAGIAAVLVQYPRTEEAYARPNRAMQRAGTERGVPLVDSRASLARVPLAQRTWGPSLHPSGPIYLEVARDLAPIVTSLADER